MVNKAPSSAGDKVYVTSAVSVEATVYTTWPAPLSPSMAPASSLEVMVGAATSTLSLVMTSVPKIAVDPATPAAQGKGILPRRLSSS